jgi:hypothetical protein
MDKSKTNKSNVDITVHLASISSRCAAVGRWIKGRTNFRGEAYSNDSPDLLPRFTPSMPQVPRQPIYLLVPPKVAVHFYQLRA